MNRTHVTWLGVSAAVTLALAPVARAQSTDFGAGRGVPAPVAPSGQHGVDTDADRGVQGGIGSDADRGVQEGAGSGTTSMTTDAEVNASARDEADEAVAGNCPGASEDMSATGRVPGGVDSAHGGMSDVDMKKHGPDVNPADTANDAIAECGDEGAAASPPTSPDIDVPRTGSDTRQGSDTAKDRDRVTRPGIEP